MTHRVNISQWLIRLIAWNRMLPVTMWSVPFVVRLLVPNNRVAIELAAVISEFGCAEELKLGRGPRRGSSLRGLECCLEARPQVELAQPRADGRIDRLFPVRVLAERRIHLRGGEELAFGENNSRLLVGSPDLELGEAVVREREGLFQVRQLHRHAGLGWEGERLRFRCAAERDVQLFTV